MIGCLGGFKDEVYREAHTREYCDDSERSKDKGDSSRFKLREVHEMLSFK